MSGFNSTILGIPPTGLQHSNQQMSTLDATYDLVLLLLNLLYSRGDTRSPSEISDKTHKMLRGRFSNFTFETKLADAIVFQSVEKPKGVAAFYEFRPKF